MNRFFKFAAVAALISGGALLGTPADAGHKDTHLDDRCSIIAKFDRDRDGKLNIFEAKRAGKSLFKKLNPDRDFTLEYDEVDRRISPATFKKWNKIGRKGLDRIEWTRLVKHRFRKANARKDRRGLGCHDLLTHAGHRFLAVTFH